MPRVGIGLFIIFWLATLLRLVFFPSLIHADIRIHYQLAERIRTEGLRNVYHRPVYFPGKGDDFFNLPPGATYLFWFSDLFYQRFGEETLVDEGERAALGYAYQKLPGLFGDLGLALLVYWLFQKVRPRRRLLLAAALLFNPAFVYLSGLWGQFDSWVSFLAYAGLAALGYRFLFVGLFLIGLSLFTKYTLLVLVPFIVALCLKQGVDFKRFFLAGLGAAAVPALLALPFGFNPQQFAEFYSKNIWSSGRAISANATNFWGIFFNPNSFISDQVSFGPGKAAHTGTALFVLVYFLVLVRWWKRAGRGNLGETIFPAAALITYAAFLFLPRMHERYLFPTLFPLLVWAGQSRSKAVFLAYLLTSLLFLLNLYVVAPLGLPALAWLVDSYHSARDLPVLIGAAHLVIFSGLFYRFVGLSRFETGS
jgi:hypothetical protein